MGTLLGWFSNQDGYMPHGHCYLWQPSVLWLHVVANALIAAAYIAIPLVLYWFVRRRRHELPYWWMPVLFAAFILLCGFTHVSNIWVIWNPDYRVDGVLKLVTGVVSVTTAVALAAIMPRVMQLQTPTQLIAEVDARTAALRASNEKLRDALAATERYAAAAADSEQRFRQIADLMPDVVFVAGADGRVEYVNPRWAEKTGAADATPDAIRTAIVDEDRAALAQAWAAAQEAGQSIAHEFRMRHRQTGIVHWFVVRARPVRDEAGRIVRWVGSATDIDAQKRAQEVLADADARKDAFLATLAHELRNPLAPIRYAIRLLEPGVPEEAAATARAMIRRQLAHMARLLDDLLDVGRITRGTLELRPEPLDVRAVVHEAAETVRPLLDSAGHTLHLHLPDEPVCVEGDGMRLQQVVGNLLNNAARYSDPGGRIDVELRQDAEATQIVVRDTGSGIETDALERIFELFTQGDRTPRSSAGLGIGLALARQIVQLHGGTLRAASAGPGHGSTFTVTLPRTV